MSRALTQRVADCFDGGLRGTSGVVALSGGPDSVCLALILRDLQQAGVFPRLATAHLNHCLRGPESDADEVFALSLAQSWGLSCRTRRLDVAAAASERGLNLEATARSLRYDWLMQVAQEEGAAWVATGHNADDQAETVLFRLLRGSGLQGLAGMRPRRPLTPDIELVRPLLGVRRAEILAFLEGQRQNYRDDSSNLDARLTRNRIRHELLPRLTEDYNPALTEVLCRLADQARAAHVEMGRQAAHFLKDVELPRAGAMVVLLAAALEQGSRTLRRELFRLVWQRESWPMGNMTFETWDRLAQLVEGGTSALDLPDGVRARRMGRVVQLEKG